MNKLHKFIVISTAMCSFASTALEKDKSAEQLEKELTITARENNIETVKNFCISKWSEKQSIEILSKFSTLAEFCTCTQEEMKYLVPDVLSVNLLKLQVQTTNKNAKQYLTEEEMSETTTQWYASWTIANKTCGEKFMRRKK